ncbi:hypothetical protein MRX96_054382 [Rhipicephalus microplus]
MAFTPAHPPSVSELFLTALPLYVGILCKHERRRCGDSDRCGANRPLPSLVRRRLRSATADPGSGRRVTGVGSGTPATATPPPPQKSPAGERALRPSPARKERSAECGPERKGGGGGRIGRGRRHAAPSGTSIGRS